MRDMLRRIVLDALSVKRIMEKSNLRKITDF